MRVLLVEDDNDLGSAVTTGLSNFGYAVDWLKDGGLADEALKTESFDAVVLDLGLPTLHGLDVLRNLRSRGSKVPVMILTAFESIEDRVRGLDAGADDYLVKPFNMNELDARLRALMRRTSERAESVITYGEILLDPASHQVNYKGDVINIPRREYALLLKLLENTGKALSRDQLGQSLYSWDEDIDSNALEVHIHNLRKKFGNDFIRTIRGVGYMVEKEQE